MFQLTLSASVVAAADGRSATALVRDLTDWTQAPDSLARASWAVLLTGTRLGSTEAQNVALAPLSYNPVTFQSTDQSANTVAVPLPDNGVFRLQAVAVPVITTDAQAITAQAGRVYYRLSQGRFLFKVVDGVFITVETWADVLKAAVTDVVAGSTAPRLLDKAGESYALSAGLLASALARLNLAYLQTGGQARQVLQNTCTDADLLLSGARRQFALGYYPDAATTLTATQRLLQLQDSAGCLLESAPAVRFIN